MRINEYSRQSQEKLVLDQQAHKNLLPAYSDALKALKEAYPVVEDKEFRALVNFKTNKVVPIHRWFDYKEGYSERLVELILQKEKPHKDQYIFDPFGGVGTTQVTAQNNGYKSLGLDVNPIAVFAAQVKSRQYSAAKVAEIDRLLQRFDSLRKLTTRETKYQKVDAIFHSPEDKNEMLEIKGFYESIPDVHIADFFKLAFLAIVEPVSNRVKDGNGIKISKTKKPVESVTGLFKSKVREMLADVSARSGERLPEVVNIEGSLLNDEIQKQVSKFEVGTTIFSPPYANCFDYCEVYKMEIWLGDFVDDYADFKKYRNQAVRSHVNSKFDPTLRRQNDKVDVIASLIGTFNIWNKNIPNMIRGYFDDMEEMIRRIHSAMEPGTLCSIVVANSGYKGLVVPTDLLLAEAGDRAGFDVEKIIFARPIRSSSQQMSELRATDNLTRESIIMLRKA